MKSISSAFLDMQRQQEMIIQNVKSFHDESQKCSRSRGGHRQGRV